MHDGVEVEGRAGDGLEGAEVLVEGLAEGRVEGRGIAGGLQAACRRRRRSGGRCQNHDIMSVVAVEWLERLG